MKKCVNPPRLWLIAFLCLSASSLLNAADITGTWEVTSDMQGNKSLNTLILSAGPGDTLSGTWNKMPIINIKFANDTLTFDRVIETPNQDFTMSFSAALKNKVLKGTFGSDQWEATVTGKRPVPMCPALGKWHIEFKVQDRDIVATLTVSQDANGKLAGQWDENIGEHQVTAIAYKDGKLTLTRESQIENFEFTSTYEATIKDHALAGKLTSDMGEWDVNGTREGAALIGQWELTIDAPMGPPTRLFVVYPDMTARYQWFDGLVDVKDLKLTDNKVMFTIESNFGDRTFTTNFAGTLAGDTLKGELNSDWGNQPIEGKRIKEASPLIGTWQFTRETQRGTSTSTLVIKDDMTATYTMREEASPVEDLKIEGHNISFKLTRTRNDQEFTMTFSGMLEGDSLKLNMAFGNREPREMIGKKIK